MRWAAPELLVLLWLIPAAIAALWWRARLRARDESGLGDPSALRRRWGAPGPWNARWRAILLLLAMAAAIVGLARPQAGLRLISTTSVGPDVVIALDLSASMSARDARPDRLAAARREVSALLHHLEGSAVGLVGFAGEARVLSPLTTDLEGLRDRIDAAGPGEIGAAGSDVGRGVALAGRLLTRPGQRPRAIVLLTDGEQLDGDPSDGIASVRKSGARLAILGIGSPEGAPIPLVDSLGAVQGTKRDDSGREIRTTLVESTLRDMATSAGGRYERADGSGSAARRAAAYARGEDRGTSRGRSLQAYDERFHWLAALAVLLLVGEAFVPRRSAA